MRQRVTIAMALAGEPRVLIADEPTTALDVTVQAEIVGLIQTLQRQTGMSVIWVTHDMALLARIADRVLVMYGGRIVEDAPVESVFASPRHPYTQTLLANLRPEATAPAYPGAPARSNVPAHPGALTHPSVLAHPGAPASPGSARLQVAADPGAPGCPFAPRCPQATDKCRVHAPSLSSIADRVRVACWAVSDGGEVAASRRGDGNT
jgi:ABC-type dipeptide/oligopeptide/nickel transport system ATPase component